MSKSETISVELTIHQIALIEESLGMALDKVPFQERVKYCASVQLPLMQTLAKAQQEAQKPTEDVAV